MQDRVADVLAQRTRLDRGPGAGVAASILLHVVLGALVAYGAMHATPSQAVNVVNIQFAAMPAAAPAPAKAPAPRTVAPTPRVEEPKPVIQEPSPVVPPPVKPPEKNTVPLSPFGRSAKRGSETPPPPPAPRAATPVTPAAGELQPGTVDEGSVPLGGSGVTGLEGGDFPHALYIQGMHRRIGGNWVRPQLAGGGVAVVYFRISRDGTITEAKLEKSSGNGTFDRAALSAVRSASPLNPLPFAYSGTYLGVHLTFK